MAGVAIEVRADRATGGAEAPRGPIVSTPDQDARRYAFSAQGTLGNFFNGIVCPQAVASPAGVVPEWTREVQGEVKAA